MDESRNERQHEKQHGKIGVLFEARVAKVLTLSVSRQPKYMKTQYIAYQYMIFFLLLQDLFTRLYVRRMAEAHRL